MFGQSIYFDPGYRKYQSMILFRLCSHGYGLALEMARCKLGTMLGLSFITNSLFSVGGCLFEGVVVT